MAEREATVAVVRYQEGDTPLTLPGLAVAGVKLMGLYTLVQALPQLTYLPSLLWEAREGGHGSGHGWDTCCPTCATSSSA